MTTATASEHTAAPWGVLKVPGATSLGIVPLNSRGKPRDGRSTEDIASVCLDHDNAEANARLMASSPDLLSAARFALSVIRNGGQFEMSERMAVDQLEAAIAKATV